MSVTKFLLDTMSLLGPWIGTDCGTEVIASLVRFVVSSECDTLPSLSTFRFSGRSTWRGAELGRVAAAVTSAVAEPGG